VIKEEFDPEHAAAAAPPKVVTRHAKEKRWHRNDDEPPANDGRRGADGSSGGGYILPTKCGPALPTKCECARRMPVDREDAPQPTGIGCRGDCPPCGLVPADESAAKEPARKRPSGWTATLMSLPKIPRRSSLPFASAATLAAAWPAP
jgi:hypothetical protein